MSPGCLNLSKCYIVNTIRESGKHNSCQSDVKVTQAGITGAQ